MAVTSEEILFKKNRESSEIMDKIPLDQVEKAELSAEVEKFNMPDNKTQLTVKNQRRDSNALANQDKDSGSSFKTLARAATISSFQHFHGVQIVTRADGELCGRIYHIQAKHKAHSYDIVKTLQKYSERARARAERRGRFEMSQIYLREVLDHQYFRALVVFLILAVNCRT